MSREITPEERREIRHSLERWRDEDRNGLADPGRDGNPLADLLAFLSDGFHTGTLLARSLAFLWVLRPDLVAVEREAGTLEAVAAKAGLGPHQLSVAVRRLRETAPDLDQAMRGVLTSRARFLALAEIRSRRRQLALEDREAMAEARKALAHERVRSHRRSERQREQSKRLRVARQVLALADPLLKAAAEDMRAFDRSLGLHDEPKPAPPSPPPADPAEEARIVAFDAMRAEIAKRRGAG